MDVGLDTRRRVMTIIKQPARSARAADARQPTSDPSARFPALGPAPEELDLLLRPRAVAGHGAGLKAAEDGVGVTADIFVGPEIECELHRLAVAFAEHGLDVGLEAHGLVGIRDHGRSFQVVVVLEYASKGQGISTRAPAANRYISAIMNTDRKPMSGDR
jgi:hypothetical protein